MITRWRSVEESFTYEFYNEDWGKAPEGEIDIVRLRTTREDLYMIHRVRFAPKDFIASDWQLAEIYRSDDIGAQPGRVGGEEAVGLWTILNERAGNPTNGGTAG